MKSKVAAGNMSYKIKDVLKLTKEANEGTSASVSEHCFRHIETVEERFWTMDSGIEKAVRFMIEVSDEEELSQLLNLVITQIQIVSLK